MKTQLLNLYTDDFIAPKGYRPKYYRSGTGYIDDICIKIADKLDHIVVNFNIIGDGGGKFKKNQIIKSLLKSKPGSIIILHMNQPGSPIADAVKEALPILKRNGYRFVKLSDNKLK